MVTVTKSAGGSAVLKSRRGGNTEKEKNEVGIVFGGKITTLCQSFNARVVTKRLSVVIRPYGLFCLAACSCEVMIASETEEVNRCDVLSVNLC